jgi:gluconate 2-dehydrogenase alpha chain
MAAMSIDPARLSLTPGEARTAAALVERLFPADAETPGATEIGVLDYLDRALAGHDAGSRDAYRLGLALLDQTARARHARNFADCAPAEQDAVIAGLERGELPDGDASFQAAFFNRIRAHVQEGLFADPAHGGNRDKLGWRMLGHPGVWLEHTAEENLSPEPVDKGGVIRALADVAAEARERIGAAGDPSDADPWRGARPPDGPADVVLVGVGAVGAMIAPILAGAGLRVVALEAGPWRDRRDFLPDELGMAFYGRASMGPKYNAEWPRWRPDAATPSAPATASLGSMVNGVGGSIHHYGGWLRRFHPHHFRSLSRARERWGERALPEGCTLADWPVSYEELEPYFERVERLVGVAGDADQNPFVPRSAPYPLPPLRPFRLGEFFRAATEAMGLHPHMVPAGMNSFPYGGRPATTYTPWSTGYAAFNDDRWHPGLLVPAALATGNLDLRTGCRVIRVLTDADGHAAGVEYVDALGRRQEQRARTVILAGYTFENVRLLLLSGDGRHPDGLGNNRGQVGLHFMTKMFHHVDGFFPGVVFNRHTGPAAQSMVLDDLVADQFDSVAHGFLGGATLSAENQMLPIQISREALPPDTPRWGRGYKDFIRQWQHWGTVRIQPDALPYAEHRLDLDPHHRDRSGVGLPVIRITYRLQPNELRQAAWMEEQSEAILERMGAARTWRGPRFTGVASSHDLGGCRMGHDPAASVVDAELRVHDTPGLYVYSGATFPTCPGVNPTMTLWALTTRAAERLVARLRAGEER